VLDLLKTHFRPEFLNRLDETVLFKPLGHAQIAMIVKLQLEDLRSRLKEQELALDVSDEAIAWLADKGYDPVFGARPVKRALQRELETPIARKIVGGDYLPGATVHVTVSKDALKLA
jgi:ATP-dependent Clp protease ATP-binding subunit ClpB